MRSLVVAPANGVPLQALSTVQGRHVRRVLPGGTPKGHSRFAQRVHPAAGSRRVLPLRRRVRRHVQGLWRRALLSPLLPSAAQARGLVGQPGPPTRAAVVTRCRGAATALCLCAAGHIRVAEVEGYFVGNFPVFCSQVLCMATDRRLLNCRTHTHMHSFTCTHTHAHAYTYAALHIQALTG